MRKSPFESESAPVRASGTVTVTKASARPVFRSTTEPAILPVPWAHACAGTPAATSRARRGSNRCRRRRGVPRSGTGFIRLWAADPMVNVEVSSYWRSHGSLAASALRVKSNTGLDRGQRPSHLAHEPRPRDRVPLEDGMRVSDTPAGDPLWKGRLSGAPDPEFDAFQRSLPFDARLLPYDLAVNAAWARALERAGLVPTADRARLVEALEAIGRELPVDDAARRE